jgi:hypothetical protein
MTVGSQTGSFWICPKCRRHVPTRSTACQCGTQRETSFETHEAPRKPTVEGGQARNDRGGGHYVWAAAAISMVALAAYAVVRTPPPPNAADSELARRIRNVRENRRTSEPQVVYVPVPIGSVDHSPKPEAEASAAPQVEATALPPEPRVPEPVIQAAATTPPESDVDTKRRIGAADFDREVAALSQKADDADVAWQRFVAGCRKTATSVTAVAGVADRTWIGVAGVNVTTTQWTDACAEAGTFFALARQVRDGMCVAEDRARQHWVEPGTRREIRHKYRLDWEGWDKAC